MNFKILHERSGDDSLIEPLLDRCFGFDRHDKTVYRLREGVAPIEQLSFVALAPDRIRIDRTHSAGSVDPVNPVYTNKIEQIHAVDGIAGGDSNQPRSALAGELLGALRFWPICIGRAPAILLGPLAVEPALQGAGVGRGLLRHGLTRAKRLGARICVVVGAPDYYAPFGFENAAGHGLILPGPVEPERFQVLGIVPGALDGVTGLIGRAEDQDANRRSLRSGSAA
jgi:predicted N-acetyltransferase YhbS